jgi:hypothetical protein
VRTAFWPKPADFGKDYCRWIAFDYLILRQISKHINRINATAAINVEWSRCGSDGAVG